jgi:hypothetical protein
MQKRQFGSDITTNGNNTQQFSPFLGVSAHSSLDGDENQNPNHSEQDRRHARIIINNLQTEYHNEQHRLQIQQVASATNELINIFSSAANRFSPTILINNASSGQSRNL